MTHISDRVFLKNFSMLLGALVALTIMFFFLARIMGSLVKTDDVVELKAEEQTVAERIRPVGQLKVADTTGGQTGGGLIETASAAADGKSVYDTSCAVCHVAGVAGAPKFGDKAAWKDRVTQSKDTLYEHAIKGFQGKVGFMPAKGGNVALSDDAVKAAVDYMLSQVQ
ncbi:MAG: c-type cytochrome [Acidiferrobacterales bacterium]